MAKLSSDTFSLALHGYGATEKAKRGASSEWKGLVKKQSLTSMMMKAESSLEREVQVVKHTLVQ